MGEDECQKMKDEEKKERKMRENKEKDMYLYMINECIDRFIT